MPAKNDDASTTPLAPDINAAARTARDAALAALEATRQKINDQWPKMSTDQKLDALNQMNEITSKENAIRAAFVTDIFNSQAHQAVLNQIVQATKDMNTEAEKIKKVADAFTQAAKVLGYAAQVAGFFASLAA